MWSKPVNFALGKNNLCGIVKQSTFHEQLHLTALCFQASTEIPIQSQELLLFQTIVNYIQNV
jgi:hypothetical protein